MKFRRKKSAFARINEWNRLLIENKKLEQKMGLQKS